jgi:hypothetical protein
VSVLRHWVVFDYVRAVAGAGSTTTFGEVRMSLARLVVSGAPSDVDLNIKLVDDGESMSVFCKHTPAVGGAAAVSRLLDDWQALVCALAETPDMPLDRLESRCRAQDTPHPHSDD